MNIAKLTLVWLFLATSLSGCAAGHNDYVDFKNSRVGKVMPYKKPFKFKNAGEFIRADYVLGGQGLTSITKDESGNLIYHFFSQEVLSNHTVKEWVGKCLTYYIVDPNTFIIKSWGFDKGGNPQSCRNWP